MTEDKLDQNLKSAFEALSPDDFAKTRVWAKIEANAEKTKKTRFSWVKYAAPAALLALVLVVGGRGLLNGKFGFAKNIPDTGIETQTSATDATAEMATEMATAVATAVVSGIPEQGAVTSTVPMGNQMDAYLLNGQDHLITVNGKRYLLSWGAEGTDEIIGIVEDATAAELVGWEVYATDIDGMVAIKCYEQPMAAQQWLIYRYAGTADGDGTMADWLKEYGITADSVESVQLCDSRLERVVSENGRTNVIPCRVTITDRAKIAILLSALSAAEEDLAEVWKRLEAHSGGLDVIEIEVTLKSGGRRIDLALWPQLDCLPIGYVTDEALEDCLALLIDEEWN